MNPGLTSASLSNARPQLFSKYLGDTEKSIRWLFKQARIAAPTIIFLDEIDAVGLKRTAHDMAWTFETSRSNSLIDLPM